MTDSILRLPEVIKRTGRSRTSIYCAISEGTFPKQIKLGERSSGWLESEIQQWIDDCVAASRNEKAA